MTTDNEIVNTDERPEGIGLILQNARSQKGFSIEYVASKLHLRGQVVSLIEEDAFEKLPQDVFVKGYLRAYAKCVDVDAEPLIEKYDNAYACSRTKTEAYLWQRRKDVNRGAHLVKWLTILSISAVILSTGFWFKSSRDTKLLQKMDNPFLSTKQIDKQQQITNLNKMHTVLTLPGQETERG